MTPHADRHFIFYAKSHYVRGVLMDDLKILVAAWTLFDPEQVSNSAIYNVVLGVFLEHVPRARQVAILSEMFVPRCDEQDMTKNMISWKMWDDNCPLERFIRNMLTELMKIKIVNERGEPIIELGTPDPQLIPLNNPESWKSGKFVNC